MAKIYISSTYKDLKDYRALAIETVKEMGHEPVCMEDYGASEQPPVFRCLSDVQRCDGYLGIVAWRYGFVPEGYGGRSITHLEYDTAGRRGIERMVLLQNENADVKRAFIDVGEKGRNVAEFREMLGEKHTVAFFEDKKTFVAAVRRSIGEFERKMRPPDDGGTENGDAGYGEILPYLCNRDEQHTKFWDFFKDKIKKNNRKPQFVFIHGDEKECPDSFFTRIVEKSLFEYAERELEGNKVICKENEIEWPDSADVEACKESVTQKLLNHFLPGSIHDLTRGAQLCDVVDLSKHPMVVVSHTISSTAWHRHSRGLLDWYIRDFWSDCDWGSERPLFLVFFKILYCEPGNGRQSFWFSRRKPGREDIQEELRELAGELETLSCSVLLLDELAPVNLNHVLAWMRSNRYYKNDMKRKTKAESLLKKVCGDLNRIRMCLAEEVLEAIVAEHRSKEAERMLG